MENHLVLFVPLSIKELVLRKVAVLFCSNSDVLKFFYQSLNSWLTTCQIKEWREATEEMLKLGLPKSLNKQVIDRIQDIGLEIREWKRNNVRGEKAEIELPEVSKLCWTSRGTIDYRKIAEQYVLCDRLEHRHRYEIACSNCMENHILLLWNKLSTEDKLRYMRNTRVASLEGWWSYIIKGEQSKLLNSWNWTRQLTSFNQWVFEKSAHYGKPVAAEYFFQKLTPEEREVSLMRTAYRVTDGDVMFYLLSLMTPGQQMEMVKARPIHVLSCFLVWPRRHLLPENAGLIWSFFRERDYGNLFGIFSKSSHENSFPKLFEEFFQHAPLDIIKKSFAALESDSFPPACQLLCTMLNNGDSESIVVMFRNADAASRMKLILRDEVFNRFYICVLKDRWDVVEVCLREAAMSAKDKCILKESFRQFLDQMDGGTWLERKFRRFFEFFHETNMSDDKAKEVTRLQLE